ncbi:MAG: hypothetical protein PHX62_05770, partial [Bacilli bacterium]|nr:hypothetical protein [Bacilli bacterium]
VINKATQSNIVVTDYEGLYDGNPHLLNVTGMAPSSSISYSLEKDGVYTEVNPSFMEVGVYNVYFKIINDNYTDYLGSGKIEILKATPNVINYPTVDEAIAFQRLSDLNLENGNADVSGEFIWKDADIEIYATDSNTTEFDVLFIPDDLNYETLEFSIEISIAKAYPYVDYYPIESVYIVGNHVPDLIASFGVPGEFILVDSNQYLLEGFYSYEYEFIPEDIDNYQTISVSYQYDAQNYEFLRIEVEDIYLYCFAYDIIEPWDLSVYAYYTIEGSEEEYDFYLNYEEYVIIYQNAPDCLLFGDTYVTISYKGYDVVFTEFSVAKKHIDGIFIEYTGSSSYEVGMELHPSDFTLTFADGQHLEGELEITILTGELDVGWNEVEVIFYPEDENYHSYTLPFGFTLSYPYPFTSLTLDGNSYTINQNTNYIYHMSDLDVLEINIDFNENYLVYLVIDHDYENIQFLNRNELTQIYLSEEYYSYQIFSKIEGEEREGFEIILIESSPIKSVKYVTYSQPDHYFDFETSRNNRKITGYQGYVHSLLLDLKIEIEEGYSYELLDEEGNIVDLKNLPSINKLRFTLNVYDSFGNIAVSKPMEMDYYPDEFSEFSLEYEGRYYTFNKEVLESESFLSLTINAEVGLPLVFNTSLIDFQFQLLDLNYDVIENPVLENGLTEYYGKLTYLDYTIISKIYIANTEISEDLYFGDIRFFLIGQGFMYLRSTYSSALITAYNAIPVKYSLQEVLENLEISYESELGDDYSFSHILAIERDYIKLTITMNGPGVEKTYDYYLIFHFIGELNDDIGIFYDFYSEEESIEHELLPSEDQTFAVFSGTRVRFHPSNDLAEMLIYLNDELAYTDSFHFDEKGIYIIRIEITSTDKTKTDTIVLTFNVSSEKEFYELVFENGDTLLIKIDFSDITFGRFTLYEIDEVRGELYLIAFFAPEKLNEYLTEGVFRLSFTELIEGGLIIVNGVVQSNYENIILDVITNEEDDVSYVDFTLQLDIFGTITYLNYRMLFGELEELFTLTTSILVDEEEITTTNNIYHFNQILYGDLIPLFGEEGPRVYEIDLREKVELHINYEPELEAYAFFNFENLSPDITVIDYFSGNILENGSNMVSVETEAGYIGLVVVFAAASEIEGLEFEELMENFEIVLISIPTVDY